MIYSACYRPFHFPFAHVLLFMKTIPGYENVLRALAVSLFNLVSYLYLCRTIVSIFEGTNGDLRPYLYIELGIAQQSRHFSRYRPFDGVCR